MNDKEVKKNKVFWILAVCLVFFAGLLGAKVIGFFITSASTDQLLEKSRVFEDINSKDYEIIDNSAEMAEELKRNNLFMTEQQRQCPVQDIDAIMGKEALINGRWCKAGDQIEDAIILEVGASYAKVEWNGSVRIVELSTRVPVVSGRQAAVDRRGQTGPAMQQQSQQPQQTQRPAAAVPDQLAWMGVQLTADQRQKIEAVWSKIPEQYRARMQEEWLRMPEAERTKSLQELDRMSMQQLEEELNEMQRDMQRNMEQ